MRSDGGEEREGKGQRREGRQEKVVLTVWSPTPRSSLCLYYNSGPPCTRLLSSAEQRTGGQGCIPRSHLRRTRCACAWRAARAESCIGRPRAHDERAQKGVVALWWRLQVSLYHHCKRSQCWVGMWGVQKRWTGERGGEGEGGRGGIGGIRETYHPTCLSQKRQTRTPSLPQPCATWSEKAEEEESQIKNAVKPIGWCSALAPHFFK